MIFVTGFPGFLASELMLRMLEKDPTLKFACLIQTKFKDLASASAPHQVTLIEGDITHPTLGISDPSFVDTVTRIFHFAAVYDLSVEEKLANRVNIEGTKNVLAFAKRCPKLERLDYVSTCYVSGRYPGTFHESDLEKGQSFNNFYESTKYEAERLVRQEMPKGLPTTIYRPAIVVGNSKTGETQKFDGPYFVIQWLLRQPRLAILPRLPHPERFTLNVVPCDYVLDAMAYLAGLETSIGKTYQLADPDPLTIAEMIECLAIACQRNVMDIALPRSLAKGALKAMPFAERWLGIPREALDYFDHPTQYDVSETLIDLKDSGIVCPRFTDYASTLVNFMRTSPHLRTKPLT